MIQQFIVPSLTALLTSSAALAAFYFREYVPLKKQVQALSAGDAGKETEKRDEAEMRRSVPLEASAAPANINRRGQIMRLHRSGESISSIASALGVSHGEVKLMVKVQELLSENGGV